MPENNIDDFNKNVALIFDLLYTHFPKAVDVPDQEMDKDTRENYFATIKFLHREGFIHIEDQTYDGFVGVILTTKGLSTLSAIPSSLKERKTIITRIREALKDSNSEVVKLVIGELFKLWV